MGIFRSTDPTTWDDVDQIVIAETAPPANIRGASSNVAILVGQFQRGPHTLEEIGSVGELYEAYGNSSHKGILALKGKKFGRLKIIRVEATSSVKATKIFNDGGGSPVDIISFTAKFKGVYGNNIKVTIAAGTSSGKKYTIQDTNAGAVLPTEVYDNIAIASVTSTTFAASKLVDAAVLAISAEPANAAATSLATGSDGSVANADYSAAIDKAGVELAGNVLFLDEYNATRNGYMKQHVADVPDKMVVIAGLEGDSVSAAIADVASYRDTEGRIIYAYPWVQQSLDGVLTMVQPASFYASVISQTPPNIDPAYTANKQYLGAILGLKLSLNRANYVALLAAGISAFEMDDGSAKIKSGVVTQIENSSKIMVFRRRMADYLMDSTARFLKNYQNAPNTLANRTAVKAAMLAFIESQEAVGILPRDVEVQSGLAKVVDTESLNTNDSIAAGFFKILYRQRIFSSMRFIVIQAEIGESVVVTEGA